MNQKRNTRSKIRGIIVSIVVGGVIVYILLSNIDPGDIPRAMSNIPLPSMMIAFLLYAMAVMLKAVRFRIILRTGISLRQLFPIVSLYMFFANTLPMRAGELSYVYLLKKQAKTPGTKSFASLIVGGIADASVIFMAMFVVGWHLRAALTEGFSRFRLALDQKVETLIQESRGSILLIMAALAFLTGCVIVVVLLKRSSRFQHLVPGIKAKILEVGRELGHISLDKQLLGIVVCSVLIISFRFGTQWYLVRSMEISIGIWELSFALLFGVLFSLVPIHGPAGFGTVEAPWVLALLVLGVSETDAITSGFVLHIMIIMYCIVLGIYGAVDLKAMRFHTHKAERLL